MKQPYLLALIFLTSTHLCFAQTTETFETEAVLSTTFTDNGRTFSISSVGELYDVNNFSGAGWNGTSVDNRFIDNSDPANNNGTGNGTGFTVTAVGGFNFTVKELYLFCSQINLTTHSGTLTITGKIGPTTVYTITKSSGFSNTTTFSPYNGFTKIDFATEGGSDNSNATINQLVFSSSGNLDYMALDAFRWAEALVPTWDGSTSTDWNVSSNWNTNAVPTATDNVIIPSAPSNQPQVTSNPGTPAVCADLTVESGATLTINAGKALTVNGTLANAGTVDVKAAASGIGSLITNGTISGAGNFKMEQYLTGSGGATPDGVFYYVSSPILNATAANYNVAAGNKLWIDDEASQTYPQLTFGGIPLEVGQGYVARMGSIGAITFDGSSFNTGNITEGSLTRTGTTETNRGYNLVGNPYPSTVSWDDAARTNLETTIWYRTNNGGTMTFDTYNASGMTGTNNNGGGNVTGDIPPTQAVWVRVAADGQTGSVTFDNADRSHGTATGIYKVAAEEGTLRIALSDGNMSDEQIILFNPSAQSGYDDYDSQKFWAEDIPQLYSNLNQDTLTINGLNNPISTSSVDLGMKIAATGEHTLNATSITLTETPVYLEDKALNVFQNLNTNPVYSFTENVGNIADRFTVHFSQITGINETENNINVFAANNIIRVNLTKAETGTITVLDMSGRVVHNQPINSDRTSINLNSASGIYVVKVETSEQTLTQKVSIQ